MVMICAGKILKEIAQKLDLSIKTVSTYRSRILKKMKMENNAELIRYAIKNQLVA
jgi:DNA-binding NarL/FixJ family response regulator